VILLPDAPQRAAFGGEVLPGLLDDMHDSDSDPRLHGERADRHARLQAPISDRARMLALEEHRQASIGTGKAAAV